MGDEDDLTQRRDSDDATPRDEAGADDGPIDHMAPPREPCECWCLHCRRTFMSSEMWFQRVIGDPQGFEGFWMCPTPNCSGAGFTFDIFPTDPQHPANAGWHSFDDDEGEWSDDEDEGEGREYDPEEPKWKALDEELGDGPEDESDLEGEEWKYGLQPGETPEPRMSPEARRQWEEAQREWEEEQKSYDEPDRRPRELDWSDRQDRRRRPGAAGPPMGNDGGDAGSFSEDDIPF